MNSLFIGTIILEIFMQDAVYIGVDKIEDYLERIEKLGGKKIVGPVVIPTGRFAWFCDPEGNQLGLMDKNPQ